MKLGAKMDSTSIETCHIKNLLPVICEPHGNQTVYHPFCLLFWLILYHLVAQTIAVSQFRVCTLWSVHLKCTYVTILCKGYANSKGPPNAPCFYLFLKAAPLLPLTAINGPRFIANPKKERRAKNMTSRGEDHAFKCTYWLEFFFFFLHLNIQHQTC